VQSEHQDLELIRRTAAGDRAAFTALVRRHRDGVFRYARGLVSSDQAAEDVLQETWIAVYRGASGFEGASSVRAWVLGISRRLAARTWRLRAGEPADKAPLHELGEQAGWGAEDDPEALAAALESGARVRAALDGLSDSDREILLLRDVEQLTGPEAAEILGISEATMKTRLHRARLRLLAALREGGQDA
jgi:RNA polymerase sigma factor (sigma-70 family)